MKATMDCGGRVMLPAQVRAAMALRPGQRFSVSQVGDTIELRPEDAPVRLEIAEDGLPLLVDEGPLEPVTLEQTIQDIHGARKERLDLLNPSQRSWPPSRGASMGRWSAALFTTLSSGPPPASPARGSYHWTNARCGHTR